ncbi:hypothetical protein [Microseira wollei]|uniref:No_hits_found n=1 Tax=Microseira wollei NIES-4236 TaxID=2530354 RepID=A0AAV3WIP0_9CYAN|nr:hypothetical protein [Microseira wollei]GET39459.1 No_hits_found [Microseira wollei NIES-4236]
MQAALRITTKVLPGDKVEIQLPPGSVGEEVEVFVIIPEKKQSKKRNVLEILEEIHKHGPFRTVEEIERDLRRERDSWDS